MEAATVPSNESILSAEEIHRDNLTAFRVGNKARYLLNRGLLALYETSLYRALDFPSIVKYADVNFGFSGSQTYESIRVADALRNLPRLSEAFQEGKTFWSAVREITRIAQPRTEEIWINWARGKTCRQITYEVEDALRNERGLPRKRSGGIPNLGVTILFGVTLEEREVVERAFAKVAAEMKRLLGLEERPSLKDVLLYLARLILETAPGGHLLGRTERESNPYHILYKVCEVCESAHLVTRDGNVEVPLEHAERVADGQAEKVRIKPEEEKDTGESDTKARKIDRKNTRSLTRKVLHRDGLACKNCGAKLGLQADHRKERARGGRTKLPNLDTLCDLCHALKTAGLLIAEKDENGETVYRRRSDLRRTQLEAEAKSLEAIQSPVDDSTRVESPGGPVPRSSVGSWNREGLIGEAVADLISVGIWEKEARRRVTLAMEKFKAAGKTPQSCPDLLQMAGRCL